MQTEQSSRIFCVLELGNAEVSQNLCIIFFFFIILKRCFRSAGFVVKPRNFNAMATSQTSSTTKSSKILTSLYWIITMSLFEVFWKENLFHND